MVSITLIVFRLPNFVTNTWLFSSGIALAWLHSYSLFQIVFLKTEDLLIRSDTSLNADHYSVMILALIGHISPLIVHITTSWLFLKVMPTELA